MEYISDYIDRLFFLIPEVYRLVFIFTFSFIEGLPIIGSFFPGGTIALLVGVLTNEGFISPITAITIIALGGFAGDMIGFIFGKKFKHNKWIKKIIENEKHQEKWDVFDRHIVLIILFSRVIPLVRSLPSIFAGARNIKTRKYLILSFIGSYIWAITGVYGGNIVSKVTGKLAIPVIFGFLLISVAATFFFKKKKK